MCGRRNYQNSEKQWVPSVGRSSSNSKDTNPYLEAPVSAVAATSNSFGDGAAGRS